MLQRLTIDNYALIEKSVIEFDNGFTVITGETGAGKSIMLDALSLLMGARADSKAMGNKERKMVVEGVFTEPFSDIEKICNENGIDWDKNELILRREITISGKSRGFVNDTPVNLSTLSSIGEKLIDIHSQHSNSLLTKHEEQLAIIDFFGGNLKLLNEYRTAFKSYVSLRNKIKKTKETITQSKENHEFIKFRLEQLDILKPRRGELYDLEKEAEILGDADNVKLSLINAHNLLGGNSSSALKLIQQAHSAIDGIDFELLDNSYGENNIAERLLNLKVELRDISDTLESYTEKIESDPARYEKIQDRIERLYDSMKRFKVRNEDELVTLYENLKKELDSISIGSTNISEMENQLKDLAKDLKEKAEKLSEKRKREADKFTKHIIEKISPLGLPNIKFKVDIQRGKMTTEGQDTINFLCSFNKNHPLQPISDIASGGEISRVMLGIKSVMASHMKLPTIIFDEIDTGVSGEIAHKMGLMMQEMSQTLQVIAVTHLPQVAASGNTHMKVYKDDNKEKTISHIKRLDYNERVKEIAGMLSGSTINEVAIENAKILISNDQL